MTGGLRFKTDLDDWRRWQSRRGVIQRMRRRSNSSLDARPQVWTNSSQQPKAVVAVASGSPSGKAALIEPLGHLNDVPTAAVAEFDLSQHLPGWRVVSDPLGDLVRQASVVLADGHYMALGHELWELANLRSLPYYVAQHGLITPLAPPMAPGAHLLAWSDADADFWRSGRSDVTHTAVGSQLLWDAAQRSPGEPTREPTTYLGQMHGAELQRSKLTRAAASFCRENDAVYRPHPSEKDKLSRLTHKAFRRAGITVDASRPLNELTGPVVSVFSTGVLEAAAQGRDAWVHFPRPPAWLEEFWERYGMHQYGDSPTPAPARPDVEPAKRIAEILTAAAR